MNRNISATFQIIVVESSFTVKGGSGVAIWRNTNNDIYIATAEHVIHSDDPSPPTITVIDSRSIAYSNTRVVLTDLENDFSIIRVTGVSTTIPIASISTSYNKGDDIYVIGWPLAYDVGSVSSGCIRSNRFCKNGVQDNILIDASTFQGNSGGGVYFKSNHSLIGLISWGISGQETFNAAIPANILYEALLTVQYETNLSVTPTPVIPYYTNYYSTGIYSVGLDSLYTLYFLRDGSPPVAIQNLGNGGIAVITALNPSPGYDTGFRSYDSGSETFDIIWAISASSTSPTQWVVLNEENSFHNVLQRLALSGKRSRPIQKTIISGNNLLMTRNNVVLPPTFTIKCLTSRVVNGYHEGIYTEKMVTTVRRASYLEANPDKSTYQFMSNKDLKTDPKILLSTDKLLQK